MYRKVLALSALLISACSTDNPHKQSMHHNDFELSDSAVKFKSSLEIRQSPAQVLGSMNNIFLQLHIYGLMQARIIV